MAARVAPPLATIEDVAAFQYELPAELIAQQPAEPRDSARLLAVARDGSREDRLVRDLPALLRAGDVLVVNDSRVIPARLFGARAGGGSVELLLLRRESAGAWECLGRPGRRLRGGTELTVSEVRGRVEERREDGSLLVRFQAPAGVADVDGALLAHGQVPLPPYIRGYHGDPERYQTVYARTPGSVAAPTAGLHFTPGLLERLRDGGVEIAVLTLHVGVGTFRPISAARLAEHRMHAEWCEITPAAAEHIRAARARGGRVVAVGTTVVRALESAALAAGGPELVPFRGWTDLFITPGFRFQVVDALLTNFHLPRASLLVLVSAFAGWEQIRAAYAHAVAHRYRFYSFGDAMLLL